MNKPKQIFIPVAEFHKGNTATYVERALKQIGIETRIIDENELFVLLKKNLKETHFFCVDSGKPFNLTHPEVKDLNLVNLSYWFIDFRHHKDGPRTPTDVELCRELSNRGGNIVQSQYEDYQFSLAQGWNNCFHLPLAADPEIWSDKPEEEKKFHLAFAGNVWDKGRAEILQYLLNQKELKFGFQGHGALWMEDAAKLIRQAKVGFNVNSWYGTEHAFDLNMRFYETLSCGVPLITNSVKEIERIFPISPSFLRVYRNPIELPQVLVAAFSDPNFLNSGPEARNWIINGNTYRHRLEHYLNLIA